MTDDQKGSMIVGTILVFGGLAIFLTHAIPFFLKRRPESWKLINGLLIGWLIFLGGNDYAVHRLPVVLLTFCPKPNVREYYGNRSPQPAPPARVGKTMAGKTTGTGRAGTVSPTKPVGESLFCSRWFGCHAHGFAWHCLADSMPRKAVGMAPKIFSNELRLSAWMTQSRLGAESPGCNALCHSFCSGAGSCGVSFWSDS